jgi:hypothetical protein
VLFSKDTNKLFWSCKVFYFKIVCSVVNFEFRPSGMGYPAEPEADMLLRLILIEISEGLSSYIFDPKNCYPLSVSAPGESFKGSVGCMLSRDWP